jgi:FkbM family methyltransferase
MDENVFSEIWKEGNYRVPAVDVTAVIDVGGHIGLSALLFAWMYPNAQVHVYEPYVENLELLRLNTAGVANIHVHDFALSDFNGTAEMEGHNRNTGGWSLGALSVDDGPTLPTIVNCMPDELLALSERGTDFATTIIKLDCEGAEGPILKSMEARGMLAPGVLFDRALLQGEWHGLHRLSTLIELLPTLAVATRHTIESIGNFWAPIGHSFGLDVENCPLCLPLPLPRSLGAREVKLHRYESGWSYQSRITDEGWWVDAHAESDIEFSHGQSEVLLELRVSDGGVPPSSACAITADGTSIDCPPGQLQVVQTGGLPVKLKVRSEDKAQRWCGWNIRDVDRVSIPALEMQQHNKLGDSISVLIGLENVAMSRNTRFRLRHKPVYEELIAEFDFDHIDLVDESHDGFLQVDHLFATSSWHQAWIARFGRAACSAFGYGTFDLHKMPGLRAPREVTPDDSLVLFQLDSRAVGFLGETAATRVVDFFARQRGFTPVVIGGPDTPRYLGDTIEYRIGAMPSLVDQLRACRFFVGVDSGIAHLAGILGIRSYVLNGPSMDFPTTCHITALTYPNTRTVPRDVFTGEL